MRLRRNLFGASTPLGPSRQCCTSAGNAVPVRLLPASSSNDLTASAGRWRQSSVDVRALRSAYAVEEDQKKKKRDGGSAPRSLDNGRRLEAKRIQHHGRDREGARVAPSSNHAGHGVPDGCSQIFSYPTKPHDWVRCVFLILPMLLLLQLRTVSIFTHPATTWRYELHSIARPGHHLRQKGDWRRTQSMLGWAWGTFPITKSVGGRQLRPSYHSPPQLIGTHAS